jgi:hypothetical protein
MFTWFLEEYLVAYFLVMAYSGGIFSSIITGHLFLALLLIFPPVVHEIDGQYHVSSK